jgi:hypothetical protein
MAAPPNKLMLVVRAIFQVAPRLLKGYITFAIVHVIYKVLKKQYLLRQKVKAVAGLPGYELDRTASALRANLHRLQDWRSVSVRVATQPRLGYTYACCLASLLVFCIVYVYMYKCVHPRPSMCLYLFIQLYHVSVCL